MFPCMTGWISQQALSSKIPNYLRSLPKSLSIKTGIVSDFFKGQHRVIALDWSSDLCHVAPPNRSLNCRICIHRYCTYSNLHITSCSIRVSSQAVTSDFVNVLRTEILLPSGERLAISVLPVYVSVAQFSSGLYCVVCFHYSEAHNGLHQNNSTFSSENIVSFTVMRKRCFLK